jgi:N-acetyl-gamma-glutamylphosphate reductase
MNIKVISIVGANSFVGQHLIRLLLQNSSIELKILSHSDIAQSEQASEHIQY